MKKIVNDFEENQDLVLNCCGFSDDGYNEFLGLGKKAKAKRQARKEKRQDRRAKIKKRVSKRAKKLIEKIKSLKEKKKQNKLSAIEQQELNIAERDQELRNLGLLTSGGELNIEPDVEIVSDEDDETIETTDDVVEKSGSNKMLLYGGIGLGIAAVVAAIFIFKGKKGK